VRRVLLAVTGTVAVLVLLLGFKTSPGSVALPPGLIGNPAPAGAGQPGISQPGTSSGPTTASSGGNSTTGTKTVVGQAIDTQFGPVQVQVVFSAGRITDVQPLQLPQGTPRDVEISTFVAPILAQEAVQAQSAQIDMVSGATYTSQGYLQSLQSAIDQAHG